MDTNQMLNTIQMKAKFSALWIFVLLNIVFRDIHELFRPGLLAEMMTGTVNGVELTEETMLIAGIMLEIPLLMVALPWILPYHINRWANIIVGAIGLIFIVTTQMHDLDDMFFATVEVVTALIIIWLAWTWPNTERQTVPAIS